MGAKLTDEQLAEIQRNRPGVCASLACEGIVLSAEVEALFDEMDRDRLGSDDRATRILRYCREKGYAPWPRRSTRRQSPGG